MTESLFSPSWYRVAQLKPRIRGHARIHRHEYRGELWFVLEDRATGRSHRFTPITHYLLGLMDGTRTVQQLWDAAGERFGDDAPTQDEFIQLLGEFHASDVMQCDVAPDSRELLDRYQRHERMKMKRRFASPLAVRLPLVDPEALLARWMPLVRPLFSWLGFAVWLAVVLAGCLLAGLHWPDITEDIVDRALAPHNLIALWLIYPVVKILHELGHGFATKVWGGEVHDMGIMLLVFMPVPYVDASAASAFREKRRRMVVGAAGIMVELFLAALALMVWLTVEPGAVSTIAYNVMLIGGVSTLLFNGNPLLRFDGYYVFADALEIPNLGSRANKYLGFLVKHHLLGVEQAQSPASSRGERFWFVTYGIAAFLYRMFIMFVIVFFIAGEFFVIGVLLAMWAVSTQLIVPAAKAVSSVFTAPEYQRTRARSVSVLGVLLAIAITIPMLVPVPSWARVEGVVWVPEQSQVRAGADGFITRLLVPDRALVRRGDPLIETEDPLLVARLRVLSARVRELEATLSAQLIDDRVQAGITRQELASARADVARAEERLAELTLRSPGDGVFVVPGVQNLPGRFLHQGQVVAYVTDLARPTVRACVSQDQIGLVRERFRGVEAVLADWDVRPVPAVLERLVPAGTYRLPSRALGTAGGGALAVDPGDPEGLKTLQRVFEMDIGLLEAPPVSHIGRRVLLRFDFGKEPLAVQWYRSLRQLLLKRFSV